MDGAPPNPHPKPKTKPKPKPEANPNPSPNPNQALLVEWRIQLRARLNALDSAKGAYLVDSNPNPTPTPNPYPYQVGMLLPETKCFATITARNP